MTFLPIVDRELRVAARRRALYWNRLGMALAGLLVGGWMMLFPDFRSPRVLGPALFTGLAVVAFIYSGLAGVLSTADALSAEKREGTLGLLFLTDLKGYDIVLGKLAATSLAVFFALLALFPVMAIPLLAGGVSGGQFWRVVLVCLNNLFFFLALGLFSSSISRDPRKAVVLAVVGLLFFAVGLPLLAALAEEWLDLRDLMYALLIVSPGYACAMAFDFAAGQHNFFYTSVGVLHGLGWLLLLACTFIVPRTWQDQPHGASPGKRTGFRRWLGRGSTAASAVVRAQRLVQNPFYWLVSRNRRKGLWVWSVLGVGGGIWTLGLLIDPNDWLDEGAYSVTAYLAHTILKFWVAFEACRQLAEDRRSGALELLLATPLTVRTIIRGQMRALRKQFGGPVLVVLAADTLFLFSGNGDPDWRRFMLCIIAVFIADLIALSWVGLWQALNSRTVNRAVGATVVRILVLPWILYALALTLMALEYEVFRVFGNRHAAEGFFIYSGPVGALLIDVVFGSLAWRSLMTRFRQAASERRSRRHADA